MDQAGGIDGDLDLPLQPPGNIGGQHAGDILESILEIFGQLLQAHQRPVAGQADHDNGDVLEVDLLYHGLLGIGGQLRPGQIHLLPHAPEGLVDLDIRLELHHQAGKTLSGGGAHPLDLGDLLQLVFDRVNHLCFHVTGSDSGIGNGDENHRLGDVGPALQGQVQVGDQAGDGDDEDQHKNAGTVLQREIGDFHGTISL